MTVIGFPAPVTQPGVNEPISATTNWDMNLGKPHMDINTEPANDLAHYKDVKPGFSPASEILKKASGLIDGERHHQHGDRKENHTLIARMWTAYLGVQITAQEVALMMVLLKVARTKSGSYNGDCYVDAAGYAALAGELADAGC